MLIYYLIIVFLCYLCVFESFGTKKFTRPLQSFFPLLVLFPLAAFRSEDVGKDVSAYLKEFENAKYQFDNNIRGWERGYESLIYFVNSLNLPFQFVLIIIAFFTLHSTYLLFKKYSSNIMFSYVIFFCFGSFAFALSGLRQALAICVSVYAVIQLLKNRYFIFILMILFASLFHFSALFLLIVPIFLIFNFSRLGATVLFIISCTFYFFPIDGIAEALLDINFSYVRAYIGFEDGINPLVVILNAFFPLTVLILAEKDFFIKKENRLFYLFSLANLAIVLVSIQLPMIARLGLYFSIFIAVLIPNVISSARPAFIGPIAVAFFLLLGVLNFGISIPDNSIGIDQYSFMRSR